MLLGGIEAGGTKFVCGVGNGPGDLIRIGFPTRSPKETISAAVEFFRDYRIEGLGIASFGPVDLHRGSPTFGHITTTPKQDWRNTDIVGVLRQALNVPVAFDTDVNGAVLAEATWGAARGLTNAVYLTIGTGIGGGAFIEGRLLHGRMHPEMGHLRIPHDWSIDPFPGCCPYHGDCLEGLASGPAIERRWGVKGQELNSDHEGWPLIAGYLASGLMNVICALSPQCVILGGGVMDKPCMLPLIKTRLQELLGDYLQCPAVVAPQLGSDAGVLGAIALAQLNLE